MLAKGPQTYEVGPSLFATVVPGKAVPLVTNDQTRNLSISECHLCVTVVVEFIYALEKAVGKGICS